MQATLAELASLVGGELGGNGALTIRGAATVQVAGPGEITFVDGDEKHHRLAGCQASAALVPQDVATEDLPTIRVANVHDAFAKIVIFFRPQREGRRIGVSPQAFVSPTARLGHDVDIHPGATLGDEVTLGNGVTIHAGVHVMAGCSIGDGTTIFPGAVLYENTMVGPRCIIHAGAVLGAYGFGYDSGPEGHKLSAQLGNVVLEADVEVGAGSTIDRGTYGPTLIGQGTKIDNLVQIAHNCRIGRHNMLCSQVGIAGTTTTGDFVVMAGQVGVRDHVRIGNGAVLGAMAGIVNDVPDGTQMIGIPATPQREQKLKQAALAKLPEMRREFRKLQKAVARLLADHAAEDQPASDRRAVA